MKNILSYTRELSTGTISSMKGWCTIQRVYSHPYTIMLKKKRLHRTIFLRSTMNILCNLFNSLPALHKSMLLETILLG